MTTRKREHLSHARSAQQTEGIMTKKVTARATILAQLTTKQLTLRLRSDVVDYFRALAEQAGVSTNEMIARTLEVLADEERGLPETTPLNARTTHTD